MGSVRVVGDLEECESLWRTAFEERTLYDLWEVRLLFHKTFQRPLHFVVMEENGIVAGMLPLSWIEESHGFGYFPGETWHGKTWLEQNRILCRDENMMDELLSQCNADYHIRYLRSVPCLPLADQKVDEIGYLFYPPRYEYDFENYFEEFSGKSAKRLRRELADFMGRGISFRHDAPSDFDDLVGLNLERFGEHSYFHDPRFEAGFRALQEFLLEKGWLRMTTVLVNDTVAAVDMGCVRQGVYTLLAGGTHGGFPGVAKVINLHHMKWACQEKMKEVDFLCGDFSWKTLFHLSKKPLYLLSSSIPEEQGIILEANAR